MGSSPSTRSSTRRARSAEPNRRSETLRAADRLPAVRDLSAIIKAYDVRGVVPDQLDERPRPRRRCRVRPGRAAPPGGPIVIGHDMRPVRPELVDAFAEGADGAGRRRHRHRPRARPTCSTTPRAASTSPARCSPPATTPRSTTASSSAARARRRSARTPGCRRSASMVRVGDIPRSTEPAGHRLRPRPARRLRPAPAARSSPLDGIRHLTVVVDAGNGMGGLTVPIVLDGSPADHRPDVLRARRERSPTTRPTRSSPTNLRDLQAKVRETGADLGLAFDGDADRCFVVDERGEIVSPSHAYRAHRGSRARQVTGIRDHPQPHHVAGSSPRWSPSTAGPRCAPGWATRFIKAVMAETGAVFGGEHSGPLLLPRLLARRLGHARRAAHHGRARRGPRGTTLSSLLAPYDRYVASGEINSTVADQAGAPPRSRPHMPGRTASIDRLDGLTVTATDWWFNVRPSNTEPLLRLNVEGPTGRRWSRCATASSRSCAARARRRTT